MYKIPHFTETDQDEVRSFIKSHPFVTLIGADGNRSVATQVPVLIEEHGDNIVLMGHIMKKTDHHLVFEKNKDVLVMFTGPHCYVSASWYSQRGIGGSWNYITVHARGRIELMDEAGTVGILTALTHKFEEGQSQPELVENMSSEYINTHVKAIAGFRISIYDIHPIFKLSQNRDDQSYQNIISKLEDANDAGARVIAGEMKKRRPLLYGLPQK